MSAPVVGIIGELAGHAAGYAAFGLEVFPLNADKTPMTTNGMKDATTDPEIIDFWWNRFPDALIGCRIPPGVVVLDIDPKHNGMATWKALRAEYGDLPVTRTHRSGRGDGGGHLWFVRPDGPLTARGLNRWAREHGTGEATGKHSWVSGIDLLHHGHRYTVLPPSPHPVTGKPYQWVEHRGPELDPAPMPTWLAALLTEEPPATPAPARPSTNGNGAAADDGSIADWFSATTSFVDLLAPEGWTLLGGTGDSDGSRWRHPNATQSLSATVKNQCLFVYSTNTDFEPTGDGDPHGYTRFKTYAVLAHRGDMSAAARAARELKDGPSASADDWSWVTLTGGCGQAGLRAPESDDDDEAVPTEQPWPELPAEALHGPLADVVAALAPHTEADPAGILASLLVYFAAAVGPGPHFRLGGRQTARLNMVVVGDSARARKGTAEFMARWVFEQVDPAITTSRRMNGLNSGEGLIEAVRDPKWGKDKNGNDVLVDAGVDDKRLLLFEPEFAGRLLPAIRRQGSTVSGLLRMAWDEGDLQTMNARNPLRATNAHVCVLGNTTIDELLAQVTEADISGGLLNRFLFAAVRAGRLLPFGGTLEDADVATIAEPLRRALAAARKRTLVPWGESTGDYWPDVYEGMMTEGAVGAIGHLAARGPVQVQRLALVYALADGAPAIEVEHLAAGVAFWAYAKESAELVLSGNGTLTGYRDDDCLLRLLVESERSWSMRELRTELGGWNGTKAAVVVARLERTGLVRTFMAARSSGNGKPRKMVEAK